jgi:hypothetical protein
MEISGGIGSTVGPFVGIGLSYIMGIIGPFISFGKSLRYMFLWDVVYSNFVLVNFSLPDSILASRPLS